MDELKQMLVDGWGDRDDLDDISSNLNLSNPMDVIERVKFLERQLALNEYEPAFNLPSFYNRLSSWLVRVKNVQDKLTLLRLFFSILYLGKLEYDSLYRAALGDLITPWIIDGEKIDILDNQIDSAILSGIKNTCFSAATDSMRINAFHTVNNIGNRFRPEWGSMIEATRGCAKCDKLLIGLREKMETDKIKRIVVLEDFVGTLNQSKEYLEFVASIGLPVLFVPLVICYQGDEKARKIAAGISNLEYATTLKLSEDLFINDKRKDYSKSFQRISELIQALQPLVMDDPAFDWENESEPYKNSPFGKYKTGAMFVKYTNCPNNTLPAIHSSAKNWSPIFPRSSRIEVIANSN